MKKLDLSLEDLVVDSFDTSPAEGENGTVVGHNTMPAGCTAPTELEACGTGGGTCQGISCESTCFQRLCTCTFADYTACDHTCHSCPDVCVTDAGCLTQPGYPSC